MNLQTETELDSLGVDPKMNSGLFKSKHVVIFILNEVDCFPTYKHS